MMFYNFCLSVYIIYDHKEFEFYVCNFMFHFLSHCRLKLYGMNIDVTFSS